MKKLFTLVLSAILLFCSLNVLSGCDGLQFNMHIFSSNSHSEASNDSSNKDSTSDKNSTSESSNDSSNELTFDYQNSEACIKLKNYIIKNGTYNNTSDSHYYLDSNFIDISDKTSKLFYRTSGYYFLKDKTLELTIFLTNGSSNSLLSLIMMPKDNGYLNGHYIWSYVDSGNYRMMGEIYASSWQYGSSLSATDYNFATSKVNSTLKSATAMFNLLLVSIQTDYADIHVTAADFGFENFITSA